MRHPEVWEENLNTVASSEKQKTIPVKMVELGPLGEYPQKTVLLGLCAIVAFLVLAAIIFKSRPQKPVVLGSSDRAGAVSADGSRLLVGLRDGSLRILDAANGKTLSAARLGAPVLAVTFGSRETALVL